MPVLGHGLVGVGIGVAGTSDPRSRLLRKTWLGVALLLAYLPDLMEWVAKLAAWPFPHSALTSVPVGVAASGILVATMRWPCRETSRLALLAAMLALWSHILLDMIDGGVPLWWPLSERVIGPSWLQLAGSTRPTRMLREAMLFSPAPAAGLVVAIWRARRHRYVPWIAVILLIVTVDASLLASTPSAGLTGSLVLASVALTGLVVLFLITRPPHLSFSLLWPVVPCIPVLLLGSVELYAWHEMRLGLDLEQQGNHAAALPHYARARRFMPVDIEDSVLCRTGICYARIGKEAKARQIFLQGLRRNPSAIRFRYGLGRLYLYAKDPRFRRPREAVRIAETLLARARSDAERERAARLLRRARRAASRTESNGP